MSNVQRVMLGEEVGELVLAVGQNDAYRVLNAAVDTYEQQRREMTLEEALRIVRGVAERVEAIG